MPNSNSLNSGNRLVKQLNIAYIYMDQSMQITDVSDNLKSLGFSDIPIGELITDHLDFMVGVDADTQLNLPVVNSPYGNPVSVNLLRDDDSLVLVIGDASFSAPAQPTRNCWYHQTTRLLLCPELDQLLAL